MKTKPKRQVEKVHGRLVRVGKTLGVACASVEKAGAVTLRLLEADGTVSEHRVDSITFATVKDRQRFDATRKKLALAANSKP